MPATLLDDHTINLILEQLRECPSIVEVSVIDVKGSAVESRGGRVAFEGQVQIQGQSATMQLGLDESFPLSLPLIYLVPWDAFGFIPHVEPDGYVCYAQQEGLLLNRRDPAGVVREAIERSVLALARGSRGENNLDFVDEFEAYWRGIQGAESVLSFVEPSDQAKKIVAGVQGHGTDRVYTLVCDETKTLSTCTPPSVSLETLSHRNAIYLPLREGAFVMPPRPDTFWTVDQVRKVVHQNLTEQNRRRIDRLCREWDDKWEEVVVLGLPRPSGGLALFGILFVGVNKHPIIKSGSAAKLTPISLKRFDKEYLLPRGGANAIFGRKRIAVVGCGSVGGHIALELVRAGSLDLTLIDHEKIAPENTFRHALGQEAWGTPKVKGLKREIETKFPYVQVHCINMRVERALVESVFEPGSYDLIVVALGDDTISLYLNEKLHDAANSPPTVFTWLEPYGIGGHALLTLNDGPIGCLECLFAPVSGDTREFRSINRASFAASGQSFAKDLSGCGNRFTPYGSTHALQTALLASRLATQALLGDISGNPILSWKGDDKEFVHAGFTVSSRYMLSGEDLHSHRYDYYNPNCPVCGKGA